MAKVEAENRRSMIRGYHINARHHHRVLVGRTSGITLIVTGKMTDGRNFNLMKFGLLFIRV
jgi:hypothetical protein